MVLDGGADLELVPAAITFLRSEKGGMSLTTKALDSTREIRVIIDYLYAPEGAQVLGDSIWNLFFLQALDIGLLCIFTAYANPIVLAQWLNGAIGKEVPYDLRSDVAESSCNCGLSPDSQLKGVDPQ